MNENKIKVWLTREDNNLLSLWSNKPRKYNSGWFGGGTGLNLGFNPKLFSQIKWEDSEPTEAYITLAKPQEEKEIDWEQRRYEIARELISSFATRADTKFFVQNEERYADFAIHVADALIKELKGGEQ